MTAPDPAFWQDKRVVVTGSAGLLGSCVSRSLADAGAKVAGFDVQWSGNLVVDPGAGVARIEGDIRDADHVRTVLEDHRADTMIHLAAQAIVGPANEDPVPTFEANIEGTWTVLEACRRSPHIARVVAASSDKAYGDSGGEPYQEDMPLRANHPYAASKAAADLVAQTYAESFGMPVAISRCGNLYGGGDANWSRIVPGTIKSVLGNERPVIRSDGSYIRDYLYVDDAAEGVTTLAAEVGERKDLVGEAFNFSAEERHSVIDLVRRILSLMDSQLDPDIRNEAENEITDQRVNAAKARKLLDWNPGHTLDEGLRETIAWYRGHLEGR